MAINVEDEFDRAERLAKRLERYEHGADLETEFDTVPDALSPATNVTTPIDAGPDVKIFTKVMKLAVIACIAIAVTAGSKMINLDEWTTQTDPSIKISAPFVPSSERVVVEVPGPGEIEFAGRIPTSSTTTIQSARVLNIKRSTWTELKNVKCDTARKTAFRCSADFEGPAVPEPHTLRVIVNLDDHSTVLNSRTFAPVGLSTFTKITTGVKKPTATTSSAGNTEGNSTSPLIVRSWDLTDAWINRDTYGNLPRVEYKWTIKFSHPADRSLRMNTKMRVVNLDTGFSELLPDHKCSVEIDGNSVTSSCKAQLNRHLKTGNYQIRGDLLNSANGDTSTVSVSFGFKAK